MRDDDTGADVEQPKKKKHPLGKLIEEFTPKSYRLELGAAAVILLVIALVGAVAAFFVPVGRGWLLGGAAAVFGAAILAGLLCYRGPSQDRIEVRKLGLEIRMGTEVIRRLWAEIEYMDTHTEYDPAIDRGKGTTKYRAHIEVKGRSVDLPANFLRQFDDPMRLFKLVRKNTGASLKYIEMPSENDGG